MVLHATITVKAAPSSRLEHSGVLGAAADPLACRTGRRPHHRCLEERTAYEATVAPPQLHPVRVSAVGTHGLLTVRILVKEAVGDHLGGTGHGCFPWRKANALWPQQRPGTWRGREDVVHHGPVHAPPRAGLDDNDVPISGINPALIQGFFSDFPRHSEANLMPNHPQAY